MAWSSTHLNEMPYWLTCSYPFFHTSVTSHACVADRRHERNAETALPPTVCTRCQLEVTRSNDMNAGGREYEKRWDGLFRQARKLCTGSARSWQRSERQGIRTTHLRECAGVVCWEAWRRRRQQRSEMQWHARGLAVLERGVGARGAEMADRKLLAAACLQQWAHVWWLAGAMEAGDETSGLVCEQYQMHGGGWGGERSGGGGGG